MFLATRRLFFNSVRLFDGTRAPVAEENHMNLPPLIIDHEDDRM
jgi:hypothetical protein